PLRGKPIYGTAPAPYFLCVNTARVCLISRRGRMRFIVPPLLPGPGTAVVGPFCGHRSRPGSRLVSRFLPDGIRRWPALCRVPLPCLFLLLLEIRVRLQAENSECNKNGKNRFHWVKVSKISGKKAHWM